MTLRQMLQKKLEKLISRRDEVMQNIITEEDKETRATLGQTLQALKDDIAETEKMLAQIDEPDNEGDDGEGEGEGASTEGRAYNPVAAMTYGANRRKADADPENMEYRKAFQKYMATGKMEYRADETGMTTDTNVGTVIPENLVHKIMEKFEQLGVIYNLVTKTAYAVGQAIPTDGVKPVATWVGRNTTTLTNSTSGEGATSDSQKKTLGALITFAHYKLRCEIRYTEEVSRMTLPAFEALFIKQVGEAMLRAQEFAIVEGDGYGMPTGILTNTPDTGKALQVAKLEYKTLIDAEAAIETQYEGNTKWCMTKKTFMSFMGMTDQNGQPIARVNFGIDGKPERTLLGRDVVLYIPQAGSKLKDFTAGTAGNLFAFLYDFSDYVLNTNYDLGISHAKDWDNEDHKTKAVLACDGKVIDKGSLITLTSKSA